MGTASIERSCKNDWVYSAPAQPGVRRIEAYFSGNAYAPHRHDTYSIGYTIKGIQSFDYRGEKQNSTPGRVIVLHPDELHNGQAGSDEGFHYRMLYIEPALVQEALGSEAPTLPFVKESVLTDRQFLQAIHSAFNHMDEVLDSEALDEIALLLADNLLAHNSEIIRQRSKLIDYHAVRRAREFLDANTDRMVSNNELEAITGHDRFSIARQFRQTLGTSPYRYLMMRRLDRSRMAIEAGMSLGDVAFAAGFSDQAHMTRQFKSTFGVTPGQWQRLIRFAPC